MSSPELKKFIKGLEALKQDYTCGVCSEPCKNPVTLSKCFHIICSEHFEALQTCPQCGVSLEGCNTFVDEQLGSCIESVKKLNQMFEKYKDSNPTVESSTSTTNKKRGKQERYVVNPSEIAEKLEDIPAKVSNKRAKQKKAQVIDEENLSKENKIKPNHVIKKIKSDYVNKSVVSTSTIKMNKAVEKRNNKGETLLHTACRLGKVETITDLLNQGANTNTKDNAGWTPLHEVVQNGRMDLVTLLLQYNTLINVPGQSNETPLHEAIRYNHKNIAEELVRNGADVNAKNCKGETPMQLATGEIKTAIETASDNIMQTQSVNITHISQLYTELDFDDIRIYCTSEFRTVHNKLKILAKHHSNLNIEQKWSKKVTHLIADTEDDGVCQSSMDILHGIISSVWILSTNWVIKSTENDLQAFADYEVTGVGCKTSKGPKNARYNKYKQYPGIFDGCHFYFHNFNAQYEISKNLIVTKTIMSKLVTDAGGVVLRRVPNPESIPDAEKLVPYHANKGGKLTKCSHYIIFKDMYEPMYNMQHLKALPIGWLIECIENYELCEPWPMA